MKPTTRDGAIAALTMGVVMGVLGIVTGNQLLAQTVAITVFLFVIVWSQRYSWLHAFAAAGFGAVSSIVMSKVVERLLG